MLQGSDSETDDDDGCLGTLKTANANQTHLSGDVLLWGVATGSAVSGHLRNRFQWRQPPCAHLSVSDLLSKSTERFYGI